MSLGIMAIVGLFLAALMGLYLGLLGGGGSILAVPILKYVVGFGAKEAIAASLAVVGLTSLFGAVGHWRSGNVNLRVALIFGAVAMAGTYLGARLAVFFSGAAQLALFAAVMIVAANFMFRENGANSAEDGSDEGYSGKRMSYGLIVVEGKVPMKEAVGTSLLVIAMKSAAGFVGYFDQVEVRWGYLALFTAVAIAGSLGGTYLVRYVPQEALKKIFAVFLVVMGAFILYQNRGAIPFL